MRENTYGGGPHGQQVRRTVDDALKVVGQGTTNYFALRTLNGCRTITDYTLPVRDIQTTTREERQ